MKVLLVSPPYWSAVHSVVGVTSPPLGLAYIASMIREEHDVRIIDSAILNYGFKDVEREIKKFDPDVVGITSVTPSIYSACKVAEISKKINEDVTVVLGGPHGTALPKRTLEECKYIDVIVRGEGEITARELVDHLEKGLPLDDVKGIAFRDGDRIVVTEQRPWIKNIDEIPFPSRDLLPMHLYKFEGKGYTTMLTSRGCPFGCIFCSSSRQFGGFWRGRSSENVLEEIKEVYDRYKVRNMEFLDDTFTLNRKRAIEISEGIIKEGFDISWGASSRVDTISKEVAQKMAKAGCSLVFLGIESGNQKILDMIGKRITIEQAKKAVKIIKEAGMQVLGSFILGFPQDTRQTIKQTIEFAKSLDLDYAEFSILTPYPGTPVYTLAKEQGLLLTEDWSKYTATQPIVKLRDVSEEELKNLFRRAYLSFYLRPKIIWRWLKERHFSLIGRVMKGVINYYFKKDETGRW